MSEVRGHQLSRKSTKAGQNNNSTTESPTSQQHGTARHGDGNSAQHTRKHTGQGDKGPQTTRHGRKQGKRKRKRTQAKRRTHKRRVRKEVFPAVVGVIACNQCHRYLPDCVQCSSGLCETCARVCRLLANSLTCNRYYANRNSF